MPPSLIDLPWFRESAFKAWIKNSLSTLVLAMTTAQSGTLPWSTSMWGAGVMIVKDFLGSAWDIFFGGPIVYQVEAPPTKLDSVTLPVPTPEIKKD